MKLASLKSGGRDGTLVVVSRDLSRAVHVAEIAGTMQAALDQTVGYHFLHGAPGADSMRVVHAFDGFPALDSLGDAWQILQVAPTSAAEPGEVPC